MAHISEADEPEVSMWRSEPGIPQVAPELHVLSRSTMETDLETLERVRRTGSPKRNSRWNRSGVAQVFIAPTAERRLRPAGARAGSAPQTAGMREECRRLEAAPRGPPLPSLARLAELMSRASLTADRDASGS